jgi:hypothetical protein
MSTPDEPRPEDLRNAPPEHGPDPSEAVDPLDERLSASLDGHEPASELDTPALARARDLASARDLLAVPPPPLDDISRRRLLRTALDAAPTSSRRTSSRRTSSRSGAGDTARAIRIGAVAAAVLAVIALSGWGLTSLNHGSSNKAESSRAAAIPAPGSAGPVDLHEVSNPDVLRRRVEAALRSAAAPGAAGSAATSAPPNLSETSRAQRSPSAAQCVAAAPAPAGDTPQLLGTATFHGAPALVVIVREPTRTLAFVLAEADCAVLTSQFLTR